MISYLYLFQKIEAVETLSTSFYEVSIILIPKSDKGITRKLQNNISYKHRCKNLQQNISNQIQQCIKRILHHKQGGHISGMQGWF